MMNKIIAILTIMACAFASAAERVEILTKYKDGTVKSSEKFLNFENGRAVLKIPRNSIDARTDTISIIPDFMKASADDDGYIVMPNSVIIPFIKQKDSSFTPYSTSKNEWHLPIGGIKKADRAFYYIVNGLRHEHAALAKLKDGGYSLSTVFNIGKMAFKPYEDIEIEYRILDGENADYSGIARDYRKTLLDSGVCKPISDRLTPELEYACDAPELRIRQAWKPAPPKIEEQTVENEPEVKVKMTFEKVGDFISRLKSAGVEKVQICLVGWNVSGHDGRWPTAFPVEPKLGGEEGLKELIKKAQSMGYQIVCHTNSTDIYSISKDWKGGAPVAKKSDGSLQKNTCWSGGRMYNLCPKMAWEFAKRDLPKIAELGFRGLHYIDVISMIPPHECADPNHPCNRAESEEYMNKILRLARSLFGGAASEGPSYFVAGSQDFGLYIHFALLDRKTLPMSGKLAPLWQIVFNGIILSNPATECANYTIKDPVKRLKLVEFGGRPMFYLYSAFRDNGDNWMGNADLVCEDEASTNRSINAIKKGYDEYAKLSRLQKVFMDSHAEISKDVFCTRYADGTEIVCNYADSPFKYKNAQIEPLSYKVFEPHADSKN